VLYVKCSGSFEVCATLERKTRHLIKIPMLVYTHISQGTDIFQKHQYRNVGAIPAKNNEYCMVEQLVKKSSILFVLLITTSNGIYQASALAGS